MKEGLIKLDSEGILAYDNETEQEYYLRGHRLKFCSKCLSYNELKDNIKKEFNIEIQDQFKDEYADIVKRRLKEDFDFDFSWVKVYYAKLDVKPTSRLYEFDVTSGQTLLYLHDDWYKIPTTVLVNSNLIARTNGTFKMLTHELLHIPRSVFNELELFNEEFANYYFIRTLPITAAIARKKIEDEISKDGKPVTARLSLDEMAMIAYRNKTLKDLADKNLRLRIITEKLGL